MQPTPPPQGILLDIEGTTSSISFVYDVMFPYVRENLNSYLAGNWNSESLQACLPMLAADTDQDAAWLEGLDENAQQAKVAAAVIGMMDNDIKATGLKQLQGLIWKDGFHNGQMVAHLYDDVAPAIQSWRDSGIDVRIYSSGSIGAQKLFFGHTVAGDLLDRFGGHYDTTTGPKREQQSYETIAAEFTCGPEEILFVSDVTEELSAAKEAGLQTVLSIRPGNKPVGDDHGFDAIESFAEIRV